MSTGARKKGRATPVAKTPKRAAVAATAQATAAPQGPARAAQPRGTRRSQRRGLPASVKAGIVAVAALAALGLIFVLNNRSGAPAAGGQSGKYLYQVGRPGPGAPAPPIRLLATDGSTFDLAALRGQTVLLYFEEGVGCQPCWDQLKDIEANWRQFQAVGIDRIVTLTGDPPAALRQKVADERLTTPVLADPGLAVSRTYQANQYGMMGTSADGHSFILVGKDGAITWRADYGGAPRYTMYVPVPDLLADLRSGLARPPR